MPPGITFLPRPQECVWSRGAFDLSAGLVLSVDASALSALSVALAELAEDLRPFGVSLTWSAQSVAADAPLAITCGDASTLPAPDVPAHEEGYSLAVTPTAVGLAARSAHGLFDGLQTIRQAISQSQRLLPSMSIRDWPSLGLRGIHLDLKGNMAPASYWEEAIRLLSQNKINAVLLEYEDKFPFARHPELVGPGAFTAAELDGLLQAAKDHFVEVIPLLQTLGHVEWILRCPRYADLRESGSLTQFCPQKEGSWRLLSELLEEMIAAHPDARFFHLGADEAYLLGDCPACRAEVARQSKLALYLGFVNRAIARVQAAGLRPIIWDDMIQRNLTGGGLDLLPQGVVLCNWSYHPREMTSPIFYYGGPEGHSRFHWASRQWLERDPAVLDPEVQWLEDAPDDVISFARRYWDRGEYPLRGSALPWMRFYRDHGRPVIGASAAKGANGLHAFSPLYDSRIDNVATLARAAREEGAEGVIATAWSRYSGLAVPCEPFEMGWHPYLAQAAFCWEAGMSERSVLDVQFQACYLASPDVGYQRAVEWFDRGKRTRNAMLLRRAAEAFEQVRSETRHGRRYLAHLALAARLAMLQMAADGALDDARADHARTQSGSLWAERRERHLAEASRLVAEFTAWQRDAGRVLATSLNAADVEEAILTQTAGYVRCLSELQSVMDRIIPFQGDPA